MEGSLIIILFGLLQAPATPGSELPIEFSYADTALNYTSPIHLSDCVYHLALTGSSGHSGGLRLAALGSRHGDTVVVRIQAYRAFEFLADFWTTVVWRLRIGGLSPGTYHLLVYASSDSTPDFTRKVKVVTGADTDTKRCAA